MGTTRKPYPTDVSDDERGFAAPYLALVREDAGQRRHDPREAFDAPRWPVKAGSPWRLLPHDFPPWEAVYRRARRWLAAGVFEAMAHAPRAAARGAAGRGRSPTAAAFDGRASQSTPEGGGRAGYDGHKRRNGSKVHAAVDTLGLPLAVRAAAASAQERAQVAGLAAGVQAAAGRTVPLAYVARGYTGGQPAADAAARGIRLEVVRLPEAERGFVLPPRRRVAERGSGWLARFRRLARDHERLAETLAGWRWAAFTGRMLTRAMELADSDP